MDGRGRNDLNEILSMRRDKEGPPPIRNSVQAEGRVSAKALGAGMK